MIILYMQVNSFPYLCLVYSLTGTLNFYLLTSYGRIEIITMFRLIVEYYPKSHSKNDVRSPFEAAL